ncbi:MAG: esterase family protein [Chitinophagaceae bacterium]|nr:esterase family protein [Chitinophagaceae bacterium]
MNRRFFLIGLIIFLQHALFAASVDTVETNSPSMKKTIKAVVILPNQYKQAAALPVVYLLHGYGGNYGVGIKKVDGIKNLADQYNMMIVCPDGVNSWYWDSPVDPQYRYETYVASELIKWIDEHYKTVRGPQGRAITGLSMGGHGALYLAFKHQDVFGAAGSMSGGVDIRPFPNNWKMAERLGSYAEFPENWETHSVINMLHLLKPGSLNILIDCGTSDFFYSVNKALHEQLLYRNIAHDYIARPGGHSWEYWENAIQYQLLFMHRFFDKK